MTARACRPCFALLALVALAHPAPAAVPMVPEQISYQGLLLDDLGQPRTGSVDLTVRLYDAASGGTLLYTQHFLGVALADGVFTLEVGPAGAAVDTPDDPLTTSLSVALAGDLAATGPNRFLELTVGTEGALSRTQILSVPYAEHARSADVAGSAAVADSALDVPTLNGLPTEALNQIYEHTNLDGQEPGNTDPAEGLADPDGDGIANFVDPDNDNDGLLDSTEVNRGTDLNLVTPIVDNLSPSSAEATFTTQVTISGHNFEPGLDVQFGTENPSPMNLTPTSFEVEVGPQPPDFVPVVVTLPNGESDSRNFTFFLTTPFVSSVVPNTGFVLASTTVTVNGSNFLPGFTVEFGSENPTPMNATANSFEVTVGPQAAGLVDVTVTNPNGASRTRTDAFEFLPGAFAVDAIASTMLSFDVSPTDDAVVGGRGEYRLDLDDNLIPEVTFPLATFQATSPVAPGQLAVAFDPAGTLVGVRCRDAATTGCDVEYLVDSDADRDLEDETGVFIENLPNASSARLLQPSIEFDLSGRPVLGYNTRGGAGGNQAVVLHDRNGDGDFDDPAERSELVTVLQPTNLAEVAVDSAGRAAYVYYDGNFKVRAAHDRNGDGDFLDPDETTIVATTTGGLSCLGADFAPDGDLALVFAQSGMPPSFWRDLDGNGAFDAGTEQTTIGTLPAEACDVETGASLALAHNAIDRDLLIDRNDDGDFDDADESLTLVGGTSIELHLEIGFDSSGLAVVASENLILREPAP